MLWPLIMVSRTTMRAVAWPGATWSVWMPRWREARSFPYMAAAERSARAWGSSGTRPPRSLDGACAGSRSVGERATRWAGFGAVGRRARLEGQGGGRPRGGWPLGEGRGDGTPGDRVGAAGRGARPAGGRRAGDADLRGLPGARPAVGGGAQRGGGADGRPLPGPDHPARGGLHRDLVVRVRDPELRGGAAAQGPRPRDRGAPRGPGRGHRGHRPDPGVPAGDLAAAAAGVAGGVRAALQAGRAAGRGTGEVQGLRHPERLRGRVRPRLRRAVPEPAVRRDPASGGIRGQRRRLGLAEPTPTKEGRWTSSPRSTGCPRSNCTAMSRGPCGRTRSWSWPARTGSSCQPRTRPSCTGTRTSTPSWRSSGWCSQPSGAGKTGPGSPPGPRPARPRSRPGPARHLDAGQDLAEIVAGLAEGLEASRAQSSRLPRVDCTSQKISRKVSRFEYRYSSVGSEVGSSIPFLRASSTTVSGRMVPSTWQCSSTLGSRSSAVTTSTVPPSSEWVPPTLTGAAALVYLPTQGPDERQVPVPLGVVEAVPDHEDARDVEGLVLHRYLDPQLVRLAEQHAHLQRRRPPRPQGLQQVLQGQAGVHDVLDQDHVAPLDLVVEVLEQPHHPGALGRGPVRRGRDEVHLVRDGQGPAEVGHQHHRPFEHPHQQQVELPVVLGDPRRQLGDPLPDALLVQQHRLDLLECHRHAPRPVATRPWAARLPAPPA